MIAMLQQSLWPSITNLSLRHRKIGKQRANAIILGRLAIVRHHKSMCNLYRLDAPANQIALHFDAEAGADPWAGGYVAPGRFGPVVTGQARRVIRPMHWGFPPPPGGTRAVTNVRNLESPFWIGNLRHVELRCLVPVTQFQEWSGEKGQKKQHWFSVPSQPVFAFAGIWRDTTDLPVFAFLTTEPNSLVEPVHPKAMPMILHPEDYDVWLNAEWKTAKNIVAPYPSQLMHVDEGPAAARNPSRDAND
jgi:putative SOS response-associated peptidase YedK